MKKAAIVRPVSQDKIPVTISDDLFLDIAERITCRKTLRNLSLTSRAWRAPAQSQIFRRIEFKITYWEIPLLKLQRFFETQPRLAKHVRKLVLRSRTTFPPVDFLSIANVVKLLPGLLQLTVMSVSWAASSSEAEVAAITAHPSLRGLSIMGIDVLCENSSPLSLLNLRPKWMAVHTEFIDHPNGSVFNTIRQHPTHFLSIRHFPLNNNARTLPTDCDSFCDVVNLSVQYLVQTHMIQINRIISASITTLQWLTLRINNIDEGKNDCIVLTTSMHR